MITPETAGSLFENIEAACLSEDFSFHDRIIVYNSALKELINILLSGEQQFFSGLYPKIIYINDKYKVPSGLSSDVNKLRWLARKYSTKKAKVCPKKVELFCLSVISSYISYFSGTEPPETILNQIGKTDLFDVSEETSTTDFSSIKAVVIKKIKNVPKSEDDKLTHTLYCQVEGLGLAVLSLNGKWKDIVRLSWKGCSINLFNVQISKLDPKSTEKMLVFGYGVLGIGDRNISNNTDGKEGSGFGVQGSGDRNDSNNTDGKDGSGFGVQGLEESQIIHLIEETPETLIVIEPDYLIDVTELSECFLSSAPSIHYYFLKKFSQKSTSAAMTIGNLVNYAFDELLSNPEAGFEDIFNHALKVKPLQILSLLDKDKTVINSIYNVAYQHFMNLKGLLPDLKADYYIVEPSFLSPKYGLQGRLDLLMEYKEDENRKDIVELKSGSSPSHTYALTLPDGNTYQSGIWGNHLAQTTCYNLLLDSAFAGRTGSSQVLYSSAAVYPLRNAPNITRTKQDVLQFRNWVIALEHAMMLGNNTILQDLTPQNAKGLPSYISSELYNFSSSYLSATPLELEYFNTMLTFQLREIWSEKIGSDDNRNSGFASLWKESASEKEQQFSIITGLTFEPDGSDLENLHIKFKRSDTNQLVTSFRKGDIAILYLTDADDQLGPVNQQIMKCYIKEIGTDDVIISLRNKQFRQDFFDESKQYNLEPDYIETTSKNLYQSIFQFLRSDTNRKNLLLGLRQPEFIYNPYINIDELTQNQNDIVNRSLSAKDYFLIQGPPGTGKTSYVLKNIAGLLFEKTDEDILILAYTNRAVDEICSALKNISPEMPFLRLGSKENSSHPDILLAKISENVSLIDLFERIRNTRVFVSTVSSVLANPELLEIKNFRTAIIDEASQILESQIIGILSRIDRFIMIGDERQLPSVVTQPEIGLQVKSKSLIDINLNTLGGSVFERLLKCCKNNGWDNAYGMLRQQVRMHSEIQTFPNSYFYGGLLETFSTDGWQHSEEQVFDINSDDRLEEMLASSRIIYIDSPREKISKLNRCEADRIVRLLQKIRSVYGEKFDSRTVGVITPFRAQCAEIIRRLDEDLLSKVTVDTVERFQGSEREIIIISFSVNNTALLANIQSICEIDDMPVDRKLNVSLTRARKHLILLGVSEVLQGSPIFANLINHIKDYGLYVESEEFEEIVKFPQ